MVKAVRMHEAGGPEVLHYEDVTLPDPGPGEALVRHEAIGLNYIDVYHRTGLYPVPSLPWPIGMEGRVWSRRWGTASPRSPPACASPTPARRPPAAIPRPV